MRKTRSPSLTNYTSFIFCDDCWLDIIFGSDISPSNYLYLISFSMRKRPSVDKLTSSRHETPWKCKVSLDYCEIWENSQSRVIAEAYPIWNGDGSRSHTSFRLPHVVECIGVYGSPQKYVLIERIPSRLSEVSILNEAQTLKVLCATFRGLANLQPNFGYFGLTESCICFSQSGIVKIWVNPNLSILTPIRSFEPQYNITNRIIDQVIRMI